MMKVCFCLISSPLIDLISGLYSSVVEAGHLGPTDVGCWGSSSSEKGISREIVRRFVPTYPGSGLI